LGIAQFWPYNPPQHIRGCHEERHNLAAPDQHRRLLIEWTTDLRYRPGAAKAG